MSILKQRVPLTTDGKQITTEWLKDLQKLEETLTGATGIVARMNSLGAEVILLKARIKTLEDLLP